MILSLIYNLDLDIKEKISKEQQNLHSGAISEWEYEERYEALMQWFRLETELILNKR